MATYVSIGQHDKAQPLFERALTIKESIADTPDTATILNNLAFVHYSLAHYDKALPLQQRALTIYEKTRGPEHSDTAASLNNLAESYSNLGEYEKALALQQRALAIYEKVRGPEHTDTAIILSNMARSHRSLAQYGHALPLQHRSLAITEKNLGPEHPNIAVILNNLAGTYSDLGQDDKALIFSQRALSIYEKTLGPEHSRTATTLTNLAVTYLHLGQHDQALPLQQRATTIYEKTLGPEHPHTATSQGNLASIYLGLDQHDKALSLQKNTLTISEKTRGPEHPDTAKTMSDLAHTYYALAQYDKSLPLQQRATTIYEKTLGPEHPHTAWSLKSLAFSFIRMGQIDLGTAFLKSTVNAYQKQREQVSWINEPALRGYTASVTEPYQALAALLVAQGLLSDAQLVLDMLKENEQFEFIRRNSSADPRLTRISYNANEQVWMTRYRQIADRLAALGTEEQALQKQAKLGLNAAQKQRQKEVVADLLVAKTAFESFLKEMQESFSRQGSSKKAEVSETSREALRELQGLIKNIGPDVVLLQYYITDDKVGMLLTTPGTQLARSNNLSAKDLNRKIAEFRRVLRDPKSDAKKSAHELYKLLVEPVASDLEQAGAKTIMLSLDGGTTLSTIFCATRWPSLFDSTLELALIYQRDQKEIARCLG